MSWMWQYNITPKAGLILLGIAAVITLIMIVPSIVRDLRNGKGF